MPNASFVHTNGSVVFTRGPKRPDNTLGPVQPTRKSAAGIRFSYYPIINNDLIKLRLRMSEAEKDQLISFWDTVVNGMAETFIYNSTDGVATTVAFNEPLLPDLIEKAYSSYELTVTLRVQ